MSSDAAATAKPARTGWRRSLAEPARAQGAGDAAAGLQLRASRSTWSATRSASGCARTASSCRRSASCRGSGLAYSLKFLWAPLVDKVDAPLLGRWLGRRRGWMLLSQLVVAVGPDRHGAGAAAAGPAGAGGRRPRPAAGVRRAGAGGGVRLGDAGHRHRRLAHRDRRQQRAAGPADRRPPRWATAARCWSPTR